MIVYFTISSSKGSVSTSYAYRECEVCIEKIIKDAEILLRVYPLAKEVSFKFSNSRYSVSRDYSPNCPNNPR